MYRLVVVPSTVVKPTCIYIYHGEITLSLTILHLDRTLRVTVYFVITAAWETKVSAVGLVGTCHINGVALEPTAAEKYLMNLQLQSNR